MQYKRIEIEVMSILFCIFTIILVITIINYIHPTFQLLYLYAEPNNNSDKVKEENQIYKNAEKIEEQIQEKKRMDKKKENDNNDNKNKNSIYSFDQLDAFYKSFFPIKQIKQTHIPQIYPTVPNGETYRFNNTNPNGLVQVDETDKDNVFTKKNNDGSWRIEYGKPRIDIHTKDAGVIPDKAFLEENSTINPIKSWNFSELKEKGFWYKSTDWTNVEVTLIFKLLDSSRGKDDQHSVSIVTRSITHAELDNEYKKSGNKPKFFCGGSSYHNNLSNEGNVRMKKEQFHIDYEWERYNKSLTVGNIYDKIVGFKGIVYNINDTAVKLETWVDTENQGKGPYKKVHEFIDNGDWGDNMKKCGAEIDTQAITWGSPTVIIKTNDFLFDIYDIEVREIVPPNQNQQSL